MEIDNYIKELIIRNECIILPGFGGFETQYIPANADKTTGKFIPPTKKVIFRDDYKKDNGRLVAYIASRETISSKEAAGIVENYIRKINQVLDSKGQIKIEGIGVFNKSDNDKLTFKPIESENFLIDSFGLSEIKIEKIKQKSSVEHYVHRGNKQNKRKNHKSLYIIGLIVVALIIFAILSIREGYFDKYVDFDFLSVSKSKQTNENKTVFGKMQLPEKNNAQNVINNQLQNNTDKQKALLYKEPEETCKGNSTHTQTRNEVSPENYQIIAGSFKKRYLAQKHADELKQKGYNPVITETKDGFYRVVLASYKNKEKALYELRNLRQKLGLTVWMNNNDI